MAASHYLSVDVGTGSVRAALWGQDGECLSRSVCPIRTWTNEGISEGSYEQSTRDIWNSIKSTVKEVTKGVNPFLIKGIGFDATCSLVAVDNDGNPVTVSPSRDDDRNVILWQDHRALKEAAEITQGKHPVLGYVGNVMSPEMEPPKLLWLYRNLYKESWERAGHFFDLVDYLTYRATDSTVRSLCTLTCKWTYIAHDVDGTTITSNDTTNSDTATNNDTTTNNDTATNSDTATNNDTANSDAATNVRLSKGWNDSFWCSIGLECLVNEGYKRIGTKVQVPGRSVGVGLSERAAGELGLAPGTPVATGIIDAHAGGIGMLGADTSLIRSVGDVPLTSRLALIGGTSSCHMMSSDTPLLISGVWGPYYSAMVPGLFLNEGGQSASGALIDYVLHSYPGAYRELEDQLDHTKGITSIHQLIESRLTSLSHQKGLPSLSFLTADYHVLPDHHGNRSPLADPTLRGMISGLSLGQSLDDLSVAYLATMQALAYNTKHIIEAAEAASHEETQKEGKGKDREGIMKVLFICGGLSSNPIFLHMHSDITGLPVLMLSDSRDAVLLGSAILAATASTGEDVSVIMARMSSIDQDKVIYPDKTPSLVRFHQSKYKVFKFLYEDQYKYRRIMNEGGED